MKYIRDPRVIIGVAVAMFCIALINSIQNDARSWDDLDLWGKIFGAGIPIALAYWLILIIVSLVKKK